VHESDYGLLLCFPFLLFCGFMPSLFVVVFFKYFFHNSFFIRSFLSCLMNVTIFLRTISSSEDSLSRSEEGIAMNGDSSPYTEEDSESKVNLDYFFQTKASMRCF